MKLYKIILISLAVLTINNIMLLGLLGYFSDNPPSMAGRDSDAKPMPVEMQERTDQATTDKRITDADRLPFQGDTFINSEAVPEVTLQQFIKSESFIEALDAYQISAGPRYLAKERKYKRMSATELYSLLLESDSQADKQFALHVLMQYKLDDLDANQLKGLYDVPDVQSWNRAEMLVSLMDMGEIEGFEWAKKMILDNDRVGYLGSEIYTYLYDHDPKFMDDYLDKVDLNNSIDAVTVTSFAMQDNDRARAFLSRNFDRILESDSSRMFKMTAHNLKLDLTLAQEAKLEPLFSSNNRHKREFAIRLVRSIDDVSTLRNYYSSLERGRDRTHFLTQLLHSEASAEQRALAKEIVSNSDDPSVQQRFSGEVDD